MIKTKIFQYFIVILIVPLYFLLTEYLNFPILKIILSVLIFYIFFGYIVFITMYNFNIFPFLKNNSLVQNIAFSLLFGILLNTFYGIIAITFQIYPFRSYIFIFFEIIALIFVVLDFILCKKKIGKSFLNFKFSSKDYKILLILFIPTIIGILINYIYTPYPYLVGWDIFHYQEISSDFLLGLSHHIYPQFSFQPAGFNFLQCNMVLLSNIPIYYLIEFNKIGILFTNGLSVLWIYLICFRITKSHIYSMVPSLLMSTFDGGLALGPIYFLPSSISWQIGLAILYLLVSYSFFIDNQQEIIGKRERIRNLIVFSISIIILIFFIFVFHFLTSLFLVFSFIFFLIFRLKFFRNHSYLFIIALGIYILIVGGIIVPKSLFDLIINILDNFMPLSSVPIWGYQKTFYYLLNELNLFISPIIGILSLIVIIIERKKQFYIYGFNFVFFFITLFSPLNAIYRTAYIIFIYNAILFSILLSRYKDISTIFKEYIQSKRWGTSIQENFFKLKLLIYEIKKKKYFPKVKSLILIILLVGPLFHFLNYNYPKYTINKIVNDDTNVILYSAYSYQEFLAAKWLADNIDQNSSLLFTDPGSYALFPPLSGISFDGMAPSRSEEFRNYLLTCDEDGMNTDLFISITAYYSRDIILILTPRLHKWVQNQTGLIKGIVSPDWINQTLIEYIDNDNSYEIIYENPEVTIFQYIN